MSPEELRKHHYERLNDYRNSIEYAEYAKSIGHDNIPETTRSLIGDRWEISEEIYDDFLNMLPPMGWRNGAFYMREFCFDNITSKFTQEGDKFYCEFARFGKGE